jgi:hypothetical protein
MVTVVRPYQSRERGRAKVPAFTSVHDIGKKTAHGLVTTEHYLEYERLCVQAVCGFLLSDLDLVRLDKLEQAKSVFVDNRELEVHRALDVVLLNRLPRPNTALSLSQLSDLVRLLKRECMWCTLCAGKKQVHFGWDQHLYFVGSQLPVAVKFEFERLGRFVGKIDRSPYAE